jgi:protein O-mannosyl-transferase
VTKRRNQTTEQRTTAPRERATAGSRGDAWRRAAAAAGLLLVTVVVYANSLGGGLALDGRGLVLDDPRVHEATAQNVHDILQHTYWWPYGESGLYRPVTTASYLFNYAILGNGASPVGYHVVNLLLHVLNAWLVWAVARRLAPGYWPAIFVAAIWAVHPVQAESVTNIAGRADLLAGTSVLVALLVYWRSADAVRGVARGAWLATLAIASAVGVFSKENAVAILGVVVLYEFTWWKERRRAPALALGCAAIGVALAFVWYQRHVVLQAAGPAYTAFTDNPLVGAGFWTARLTAVRVIASDIRLLLWPVRLSCDYSFSQVALATGRASDWAGWIVVSGAAAGALAAWRLNRAVFFACAFGFLTLLPASNLLVTIGAPMAERFLYLPSLAFAFTAVAGAFALGRRVRTPWVAPAILSLVIVGLAARTSTRNVDWNDQVSLTRAAVESAPRSYKAHALLAGALFEADPGHQNLGDVLAEAERSVQIVEALPDVQAPPDPFNRAGIYYLAKARIPIDARPGAVGTLEPERRRACERALALLQRTRSIANAGNRQVAEAARRQGRLVPEPDHARIAELERAIGSASLHLGDWAGASDAARRALDEDPFAPESFWLLSVALQESGQPDASAAALAEGSLLAADAGLRDELLRRYRAGLDPRGCAVTDGPNGPAIDPRCPVVRAHMCGALADAIPRLQRLGRTGAAQQYRTLANDSLRCASPDAGAPPNR